MQGNKATFSNIKVVATISGENYTAARKNIVNAPSLIAKTKAVEMLQFKQLLDDARMEYLITPEYPYSGDEINNVQYKSLNER